jgi:hypothetical protein
MISNDENAGGLKDQPSTYGYLMEWSEYFAPAILNEILQAGLIAKVATTPFELSNKKYRFGTIFIPVQMQTVSADSVFALLNRLGKKYKINLQSIFSGGSVSGSDLGSSKFISITRPSVAMIVGTGVNATDAGEVWHLLDQRFNMPLSLIEIPVFNRIDAGKYNTLIMVGGNYADLNKEKLKAWVQNGGTLILTEEAVSWAAQNGISTITFKKLKSAADSTKMLSYIDREQIEGAQQMSGAIFKAEMDLSHPLAYGYTQPYLSLFKANKVFMEKSKNPYGTPLYYKSNPLQSGWLSKENYDAVKNSAAVVVQTQGSGRVISIADNPNLRAFWLGGTKLMMNAIFFGRIIDAASARTE